MVPYAELHCHSNASFLDGGSHPEELAEEAAIEKRSYELLEYVGSKHPELPQAIVSKGKLDDELTNSLRAVISKFKTNLRYLTKV